MESDKATLIWNHAYNSQEINNMSIIFLLGILLGVKHAMEPDHVTSLLALCSKDTSIYSSIKISLFWGAGHTFTLTGLALVVLVFNIELTDNFHQFFEIIIGIILIVMGLKILLNKSYNSVKNTKSLVKASSRGLNSSSLKAIGLGLIHGCAGSGTIILITLTEFDTITMGLVYILLFSASLIASISIIPAALHLPIFRTSTSNLKTEILNFIGIFSIIYGIILIYMNLYTV